MRILKNNLSRVMAPYVKRKDGVLCVKRGKVDEAINAVLEAYDNEGCATVETNENGREYLIVYAADKNHLRKVQEYYIGESKEKNADKSVAKTKEESAPKEDNSVKPDKQENKEIIKGENFEILKQVGVLSESPKGWKKEINIISWHGKEPKYDIREWDPEHKKMGKGITLTEEELKKLEDVLKSSR